MIHKLNVPPKTSPPNITQNKRPDKLIADLLSLSGFFPFWSGFNSERFKACSYLLKLMVSL